MQPMNGRVIEAEETIVQAEGPGDIDTVYTVTFQVEMTREDYIRMHRARQEDELVRVSVGFKPGD